MNPEELGLKFFESLPPIGGLERLPIRYGDYKDNKNILVWFNKENYRYFFMYHPTTEDIKKVLQIIKLEDLISDIILESYEN